MYIGLFIYLAVGIIFLIAMVYKKIKKQDEVKKKRSIIILVSTFVALIILSLILVVTDTLYTILSIMIFTMPVILTIVIIVAIIVAIVKGVKKIGITNPRLAKIIRIGILSTILIVTLGTVKNLFWVKVIGYVEGVELDTIVIEDRTYRWVGGIDGYDFNDRGRCIGVVEYKNDPSMEYRVYKFKGDKENRYLYRNCCSMYFGLCTRDGAYYELVE